MDRKIVDQLRKYIDPLSLIITTGTVYLMTILPCAGYSGDSAKFQFVGYVLGTAHSTGYPTYTVLNFLFTRLFPFGSITLKANILSAVFAISALTILFHILKDHFKVSNWVALITSLTFAFTFTFWSQSIVAEVYTLHVLFICLVLYYFIDWYKRQEDRSFLIACALYALSFGHHLTVIFLLPALIYLVFVTNKTMFYDLKKNRYYLPLYHTRRITIFIFFLANSFTVYTLYRDARR